MNILVSINQNYLGHLKTLVKSIALSNPEGYFDFYVMSRDLQEKHLEELQKTFNKQFRFHLIFITDNDIQLFPVVEKRYPVEIYFRLFAAKYLPENLDRVLYLDTDIVVINSLSQLYEMDFQNCYFIGTTHVQKLIHKFHEIRLDMNKAHVYLNTGVLLINLKLLRNINVEGEVKDFIWKNKRKLMLPDQDIISALYGDKVKLVDDLKYNLGERGLRLYQIRNKVVLDLDWIRKHTVIVHYYGRNKPWKKNYSGILNIFYQEVLDAKKDY